LAGKIQKRYGLAKDEAEKQVAEWPLKVSDSWFTKDWDFRRQASCIAPSGAMQPSLMPAVMPAVLQLPQPALYGVP
jgi:hypothetical protein